MVLPTCTMEWHDVQPSPACASSVSICSLIGRSKRPLKNTAWSWQPAHHFVGFVPTTSCMYSIDFRYHWLLNEKKWCMDDWNSSNSCLWQRPQLSLVMKNVAGMIVRTFVFEDEGKNGLWGPAPSCSMLAGGIAGLSIRYFARRASSPRDAVAMAPSSDIDSSTHVTPKTVRRAGSSCDSGQTAK